MTTLTNHISLPIKNEMTKKILLAFMGSVLVSVCAQISVPMFPVNMTMQTFAVLSVGMALGARWGAISLLMYLSQGAMGLPVFSGGNFGLATLLGPSGGYLFGFVIAAYVVGYMSERGWDKTVSKAFVVMLIGNIALYITGLIHLGSIIGWDKPILAWGLTPFIIGDLVKAGVASALFPAIWNKVRNK